jgi:hypothetical protein
MRHKTIRRHYNNQAATAAAAREKTTPVEWKQLLESVWASGN